MRIEPNAVRAAGVVAPEAIDSRDEVFLELLRAFRRTGGLAREMEILQRRGGSTVEHPRDDRHAAICFEWGGRLWWPRFQFERHSISLRPGPAEVIAELPFAFDGWRRAVWFAQPNLWIGGARPIDLIEARPRDVLGAVRADRLTAAN